MDIGKIIEYWGSTSDRDFRSMNRMLKSGEYVWALFVGHLTIEKLLKAIYVKQTGKNAPRIHDLLRLAEQTEVELDEQRKDLFQKISEYNIEARYPDMQDELYRRCNREFATIRIDEIKGMRRWLKKAL
jgi:HEPN domain-containing protein